MKIILKETNIFKIATFIVGTGIGLISKDYQIIIKEDRAEIIFNNEEIDDYNRGRHL
jgi:hypothetical protein